MNLRFLRTFVAIADNAGFARAAARLHLTQSAASRQIQALEDELDLRLFVRIGRSVRLTREGEDLLVRSRQLLFDAEALGQRASALKTGEVGVLRVGATPQVIESLLAGFLLRYRKRHGGVEVHLVEDGGSRFSVPNEVCDSGLTEGNFAVAGCASTAPIMPSWAALCGLRCASQQIRQFDFRKGSRLCEKSNARRRRRKFFSTIARRGGSMLLMHPEMQFGRMMFSAFCQRATFSHSLDPQRTCL